MGPLWRQAGLAR